jgi:hypothetical protein
MFVVLTVCLIASPHTCKVERIAQSVEDGPPMACIVEGQSTVAQWQTEHPAWRVDNWKCVPRARLENDL